MKKLIALFAILVAFSATTFAANTDAATATVNVWTPIEVTVTPESQTHNILSTTPTVDITYSVVVAADLFSWDGAFVFTTTGGTVSQPTTANVDDKTTGGYTGSATTTFTHAGVGTYTVTATYTANYNF